MSVPREPTTTSTSTGPGRTSTQDCSRGTNDSYDCRPVASTLLPQRLPKTPPTTLSVTERIEPRVAPRPNPLTSDARDPLRTRHPHRIPSSPLRTRNRPTYSPFDGPPVLLPPVGSLGHRKRTPPTTPDSVGSRTRDTRDEDHDGLRILGPGPRTCGLSRSIARSVPYGRSNTVGGAVGSYRLNKKSSRDVGGPQDLGSRIKRKDGSEHQALEI